MVARAQFRNVGVPQLNLNAASQAVALRAINKGSEGLQSIIGNLGGTTEANKAIQRDVDISSLRSLAAQELGGANAGGTLENFNTNLDNFLASNEAVTKNLGTKTLNNFRSNFEKTLINTRASNENRDLTLEQRADTKLAKERAEDVFQRRETTRLQNEAARGTVGNLETNRAALLKRFRENPDSLTPAEEDSLDNTRYITDLNRQLEIDFPNASPEFLAGLVNRSKGLIQDTTFSAAERTAIAQATQRADRRYQEQVATLANSRKFDLKVFDNLSDLDPKYGPGDGGGAANEYIAFLTKQGGGELPDGSDDVGQQFTSLFNQYIGLTETNAAGQQVQKFHASDITKAIISKTEGADSAFLIDFDASIDETGVADLIQIAKDGRLQNEANKRRSRIGQLSGNITPTERQIAAAQATAAGLTVPPASAVADAPAAPVLPATTPPPLLAAPAAVDSPVIDAEVGAPALPALQAGAETQAQIAALQEQARLGAGVDNAITPQELANQVTPPPVIPEQFVNPQAPPSLAEQPQVAALIQEGNLSAEEVQRAVIEARSTGKTVAELLTELILRRRQ